QSVTLPAESISPVYAVMRKAGYFTINTSKTDYNFTYAAPNADWMSKRGWRDPKRKAGQPFFHKQQFGITHEGRLQKDNHDGQDFKDEFVNPRHPNTPLFRQANHAYKELHKKMDSDIGKVIQRLQDDGLLEDTFVFYFGDHGGVLPGSKGYIYETGLHVPFVVRIPENFKHLVDLKPGTRTDGFVEFIDFGATIMHLAGITPPKGIDGKPFMGPGISRNDLDGRDEALGMADRFDEKYDMVRSLRKGDFKYIRNYQPFYVDGLQNNYRYRMAAYREWRALYRAGTLNTLQASFYEPKQIEELYNVKTDPYETVNLAKESAFSGKLIAMRSRLQTRLRELPDLAFYPESYLIRKAAPQPVTFGQNRKAEIARLIDTADLALLPFAEAQPKVRDALDSENPWVRQWGLMVCSAFGKGAKPFVATAKTLAANDENLLVRTRAIEFLALIGEADPKAPLYDVLKKSTDKVEVAIILNTVAVLRDGKPGYTIPITPEMVPISDTHGSRGKLNIDRRFQYFAAEHN
ncbi:MAG: hypothetical protein ACI9OU_001989, partial [Candidatus Promineifilaceae bacterium]